MADSQHRQYPLPDPGNNISDDVLLLQEALRMVDGDVHALMTAIAGLAPVQHRHEIGDVEGLTSALAGLAAKDHQHGLDDLTDVDGATTAPPGSIFYKGPNQSWVVGSPASVLGAHQHTMENIEGLAEALNLKLATSNLPAALVAFPTKAAPADADTFAGMGIRFSWSSIKSTLKSFFDGLYSALGHVHDERYAALGHLHDDRYYTETETNNLLAGNMAGRAFPRRSDGVAFNLVWSDIGGAPGWIIGSSDGVNFRPYAPGNVNVGYASNSGMVGGWTQPTIANQIEERAQAWANTRQAAPYTGSNSSETSFPIGTILMVCGAYPPRNSGVAFGFSDASKYFTGSSGVAGTWRARGSAWSQDYFLAQRIA